MLGFCPNARLTEVSGITFGKAKSCEGDDAALVAAARGGDLKAFDELVRRYQRRAVAVAYSLLNHRDDAMEAAQDAFLKSFEKLGTLSQPERFGSWVLRIVNNLALNRRRSRALRKAESLEVSGDEDRAAARPDPRADGPAETVSADELRRTIRREIDALPPMQRQALVLFSISHLPQQEVAEALGCSVEAVKWHVFTARKKLKDKLKDYL